MRSLTPAETAAWPKAIAEYDRVMAENVRVRTTRMSETDRANYYQKHNTKTEAVADILAHMTHWGGFRGFLMSGGVTSPLHGLFERLLSGKPALAFPPPRNFGEPWYDLFEIDTAKVCEVQFVGESQRARDTGKNVFILSINECPWECVSSSPSASEIIKLAQDAKNQSKNRNEFVWERLAPLIGQPTSFVVRYGQWDQKFVLRLLNVTGCRIDSLTTADRKWFDETVFMAAKTPPDFPFQWQLSSL